MRNFPRALAGHGPFIMSVVVVFYPYSVLFRSASHSVRAELQPTKNVRCLPNAKAFSINKLK